MRESEQSSQVPSQGLRMSLWGRPTAVCVWDMAPASGGRSKHPSVSSPKAGSHICRAPAGQTPKAHRQLPGDPDKLGLRQGLCLDKDSAHTSVPLPLGLGIVLGLGRNQPKWGPQGHGSGLILGKETQSFCSLGLTTQALPLGWGR